MTTRNWKEIPIGFYLLRADGNHFLQLKANEGPRVEQPYLSATSEKVSRQISKDDAFWNWAIVNLPVFEWEK
jgi:hypothetical protein